MKKYFIYWISIFLLLACNKASKNLDQVDITVWLKKNLTDKQDKLLAQRFKELGDMRNIHITTVIVPTQDLNQKINVAIEGKNPPDIVALVAGLIPFYQSKGLLYPMTDLVNKVEYQYNISFLSSISATKIGDDNWAIPYYTASDVMYYRKDLLAQAGFDDFPDTWSEFGSYIQAITEKVDGVYGFAESFGICDDLENHFKYYLWSHNSGLWDSEGRPNFNTPQNISLVTQFVSYYQNGWVPPSATGWDSGGNNTSYLSGQSAITMNTGSIYSAMHKNENFKKIRENTGIALYPSGPDGSRRQKSAAISFGIFKSIGEEKAIVVKDILKEIYDPTWYNDWILATAPQALPATNSTENNAIWKNPDIKPFYDQLQQQVPVGYPYGVTTTAIGVAQETMVMAPMIQSITAGNVSVEEAVQKAQQQLEAYYNEYER